VPSNNELLAAMRAVAGSSQGLAAAVQRAQTVAQLWRFASLAELLGWLELLSALPGQHSSLESLAPALCTLALALASAPGFEAALAAPVQRKGATCVLVAFTTLPRTLIAALAAHHKRRLPYITQVWVQAEARTSLLLWGTSACCVL